MLCLNMILTGKCDFSEFTPANTDLVYNLWPGCRSCRRGGRHRENPLGALLGAWGIPEVLLEGRVGRQGHVWDEEKEKELLFGGFWEEMAEEESWDPHPPRQGWRRDHMPAERFLHHWELGTVSWEGWQPLPLTSSSFSTSATSRKSLLPPLLSQLGAAVLEQLPDPVARPGGTLAQGGEQELSGLLVFDTSMAPDPSIPAGPAQHMEQLLSHKSQGRTGTGGILVV